MERQNVDYLLHVGSGEDEGRWIVPGAEARMVFLGGEGRNEEETAQGQPGQGAEGGAAGGLSGEGPSAAEGLVDGGNQEDRDTRGGDLNELQPQEPVQQGMGGNAAVPQPVPALVPLPVPAPTRKRNSRKRFTHWQLQKLESVFQLTHYISAEVRKRLATCMGVSEAKVQNWFKKKRAKYRKYQNQ